MTFRLRTELRDALEELAKRDGRSISEQVEHYVEMGVVGDTRYLHSTGQRKLPHSISQIVKRYVVGDPSQPLFSLQAADVKNSLGDYQEFCLLNQFLNCINASLSEISDADFLALMSKMTTEYLTSKRGHFGDKEASIK
ncbi:hypothetical protein ACRAWG_35675 [Methylobacterium sp. P31]